MERTLAPGVSDESAIAALSEWLSRYQPCLFGRIAAKKGLIHYCLFARRISSPQTRSSLTRSVGPVLNGYVAAGMVKPVLL